MLSGLLLYLSDNGIVSPKPPDLSGRFVHCNIAFLAVDPEEAVVHQTVASRHHWALRIMLILADLRLIGFIEITYLFKLGFKPSQIGLISALPLATHLLANIPVGWWSDRFHRHRRLAITGGLGCLTICLAGFGWLSDPVFWMAASLTALRGVGFALYYSTSEAFTLLHYGAWENSAAEAQIERSRSWGYAMTIQCIGVAGIFTVLTLTPQTALRKFYFIQATALLIATMASLRLPKSVTLSRRSHQSAWHMLRNLGDGWWYVGYSIATLAFTNCMVAITQLQLTLLGQTPLDLLRFSIGFYCAAALAAFYIRPIERTLGAAGAVVLSTMLCVAVVAWFGLASPHFVQYGSFVFGLLFGIRNGIDKTRMMQLSRWPALLMSIQVAASMGLASFIIAVSGRIAETYGIHWVLVLVAITIVLPAVLCGWHARHTSRGW